MIPHSADGSFSVVIPVYNAEPYVSRAVASAVEQPEVGEVLLVEDGSEDASLAACRDLDAKHPKVILLGHPGGENRGAGASRNLGIRHARCSFVAFLDADDYYLPARFKNTAALFERFPLASAVAEVVGVHYYSDGGKAKHLERMRAAKNPSREWTIPVEDTGLEPGDSTEAAGSVFDVLLAGRSGWIHLNGLAIRREVLMGMSLFTDLVVVEDAEFILRLVYNRRIVVSPSIAPVALRGIHDTNRVTRRVEHRRGVSLWRTVLDQFARKKLTLQQRARITCGVLNNYSDEFVRRPLGLRRNLAKLSNLSQLFVKQPRFAAAFVVHGMASTLHRLARRSA